MSRHNGRTIGTTSASDIRGLHHDIFITAIFDWFRQCSSNERYDQHMITSTCSSVANFSTCLVDTSDRESLEYSPATPVSVTYLGLGHSFLF